MDNSIDKFGLTMSIVSRKIKCEIDRRTASLGLTSSQGRVISYVHWHKEDVFQKTLESELKITKSSITSVLNNLEKTGFIRRDAVSYDQRLKKIVLTDKAILVQNEIEIMIAKIEAEAFSCLSETEKKQMSSMLSKILDNIKEY